MSSLVRLNLAMRQPEDVIARLGKPTHWKQGRSAKSLADCWFRANDIPADVREVLAQAPEYRQVDLIDAFLERCTSLEDGRSTASQTDLLAILGMREGIAVMGVEAKVTDTFGPTVAEWRDGGAGKEQRLEKLVALLALKATDLGHLRYQLLHRTAAAILEARRYRTARAVMMVQSFDPGHAGLDDFGAFVEAMGYPAILPGRITSSREIGDAELRLAWTSSVVPAWQADST